MEGHLHTKASGGCAACHEGIEEILARSGRAPRHGQTSRPPSARQRRKRLPPTKPLSIVEKIKLIEEVLEPMRPMLQRDHGDVEPADVQGKKIYVHPRGACSGCMMEAATLGGIQQKMIESLGELVQVPPASHMPVEA